MTHILSFVFSRIVIFLLGPFCFSASMIYKALYLTYFY
jgi:hypothetical protein